MIIALLGPPASGKGTLAEYLKQNHSFEVITPGNIYRKLREENSELGRLVKESLKDGGFCPSELTNRIMDEEITKCTSVNIVLDGYPRNLEQHDFASQCVNINEYVYLNAPKEQLLNAALNRYECIQCNQAFSKVFTPTMCSNTCPVLNLEGRKIRFDDDETTYLQRYEVYLNNTMPMINKIKNQQFLEEFNIFDDKDFYTKMDEIVISSSQQRFH